MVARPPRPCFHSAEVLPEFVVWSENPAGTWLQLPRFFAGDTTKKRHIRDILSQTNFFLSYL